MVWLFSTPYTTNQRRRQPSRPIGMDTGREYVLPLPHDRHGRTEDGAQDSDGGPGDDERMRHRVHRPVLGRRGAVEIRHGQ